MVEKRLPPWEEIGYFQVPVPVAVTLVNGIWQQLLTANTNRIGVLFSIGNTNVSVTLAIANGGPAVQAMNVNQPNVLLQEADWGPLVSQAWWGLAAAGTTVGCTEIILRQWPEDNPL